MFPLPWPGVYCIMTPVRQHPIHLHNDRTQKEELSHLDAAEANDEVLVLILTGAGRSFVAGADIGQMKDFTPVQAKQFGMYGNSVFLKLENFPKPVIAAVNGFALGGGCELSMACDIRLASEKAKFGQPEVGLGITPGFGGTQRLARIVGVSNAMELILTAKNINAQQAKEIGLVSHVYPPEGPGHRRQRPGGRAPVQGRHPPGPADRHVHRRRLRGGGLRGVLRHRGPEGRHDRLREQGEGRRLQKPLNSKPQAAVQAAWGFLSPSGPLFVDNFFLPIQHNPRGRFIFVKTGPLVQVKCWKTSCKRRLNVK